MRAVVIIIVVFLRIRAPVDIVNIFDPDIERVLELGSEWAR